MDENADHMSEEDLENAARLERLSGASNARAYNPKYSKFIRLMRLILPLFALVIVGLVFAWGNMSDDNIVPVESAKAPKSIGKNELLNPRFESVDDKKQPYTITAKRAMQGEENEDYILLKEPLADIMLNSGNWVAIKSVEGGFSQDHQRLLLRGGVEMFHDDGYQMRTPILNVDLEAGTAWSEDDVSGQGPAGTIEAKGLQLDNNKGELIFTGPAKLTLTLNKGN